MALGQLKGSTLQNLLLIILLLTFSFKPTSAIKCYICGVTDPTSGAKQPCASNPPQQECHHTSDSCAITTGFSGLSWGMGKTCSILDAYLWSCMQEKLAVAHSHNGGSCLEAQESLITSAFKLCHGPLVDEKVGENVGLFGKMDNSTPYFGKYCRCTTDLCNVDELLAPTKKGKQLKSVAMKTTTVEDDYGDNGANREHFGVLPVILVGLAVMAPGKVAKVILVIFLLLNFGYFSEAVKCYTCNDCAGGKVNMTHCANGCTIGRDAKTGQVTKRCADAHEYPLLGCLLKRLGKSGSCIRDVDGQQFDDAVAACLNEVEGRDKEGKGLYCVCQTDLCNSDQLGNGVRGYKIMGKWLPCVMIMSLLGINWM